MSKPKREPPLQCALPFDETMKRVLLVKPPDNWKKKSPAKKTAKPKK